MCAARIGSRQGRDEGGGQSLYAAPRERVRARARASERVSEMAWGVSILVAGVCVYVGVGCRV